MCRPRSPLAATGDGIVPAETAPSPPAYEKAQPPASGKPAKLHALLGEEAIVMPAHSLEQTADVRGAMRKAGYPKEFVDENFKERDGSLVPADILVAYAPTASKKSATGLRVVGGVRRTLMTYPPGHERAGEEYLWVAYIFVLPEFRRRHVGMHLLAAALWHDDKKARDVRLWPADDRDDDNTVATNLYARMGFEWDDEEGEMVIEASKLPPPPPANTRTVLGLLEPGRGPLHCKWGLVPARNAYARAPRATC